MSNINTNGINANYPLPGENNSTQGFRNNFSSIKTNLNTAATEITDLQTKVLLKTALNGIPLDNNMNGSLISNTLTRGFRSTVYNLGNNLQSSVVIDVSRADVQIGSVTGNVSFQFSGWSPVNTQSQLILKLTFTNSLAVITLPSQIVINNNTGATLLENMVIDGNNITLTKPNNSSQIDLKLTTTDCGTTISVEPLNRSFKSTQLIYGSPLPTGQQGDTIGSISVDEDYLYVCSGEYDATIITSLSIVSTTTGTNIVTLSSDVTAEGITVNMPVIFDTMEITGTPVSDFGNIITGNIYYVKTIVGSTITLSDTRTAGIAGSTFALDTISAGANTGADSSFYDGSDIWKRISLTAW